MKSLVHIIALSGLLAVGTSIPADATNAQVQVDPKYLKSTSVKRVALVIGNSEYSNFDKLPGSSDDAKAVRDILKNLDFQVDYYENVTSFAEFSDFRLVPFASKINDGDLVVVYFSGHGFSYGQSNYLVPTLAPKTSTAAQLNSLFVPEQAIRRYLADRKPGALIVLLDACRTYSGIVTDSNAVGQVKGLAAPDTLPTNQLVGYAAAPGFPAYGLPAGKLSWFTAALVEYLPSQDLELSAVQKRVNRRVLQQTDEQQTPWFSASMSTDVILKYGSKSTEESLTSWRAALTDGRRSVIEDFLAFDRVGPYSDAARRWLDDHPADARLTYTQFSPQLAEYAWKANLRALSGLPSKLAMTRTLDLHDATPVPANQQLTLTDLLANVRQLRIIQATLAVLGRKTVSLPAGTVIEDPFLEADNVKGRLDGQIVSLLETERSSLVVGKPIAEIILKESEVGPRTIIDRQPLDGLLTTALKPSAVGWVSISTPVRADERERALLRLRAVYTKYLLVSAGVSPGRISTVEGVADEDFSGVRLRFFKSEGDNL